MDYGEDVKSLLRAAAQTARELGHSFVGTVHLLLALSGAPGMAGHLVRGAGVEPGLIGMLIAAKLTGGIAGALLALAMTKKNAECEVK